jgi:hypothetical protein
MLKWQNQSKLDYAKTSESAPGQPTQFGRRTSSHAFAAPPSASPADLTAARHNAALACEGTAIAPVLVPKGKDLVMHLKTTTVALTSVMLAASASVPADAAEREQVRAVINLIASIKAPNPERFERNTAHTEYVRLDYHGATVACLRLDDKMRWCYEHVPAQGARAEMLRVRNEPVGGIQVGQVFHYAVDYDLDGLADVGSTTRMEPPAHAPIATIAQFFQRGTGRGDQFRAEYQKLLDDGIQVALKLLGE